MYCYSHHNKTADKRTRSSATAERQRVSYARLSRLAHWSCNALNTATVVQLYIIEKLKSYRHYQLTNRVTYVADEAFKVICLCIIRKPELS